MRIAIIGSAGKNKTINKIDETVFRRMLTLTSYNISKISNGQEVTLVSGGAALGDHVAVALFLEKSEKSPIKSLRLYLPAKWDESKCQYSPETAHGRLSNELHRQFGEKTKRNTFQEIQSAMDIGAEVYVGNGFWARNKQVAQDCDAVIAWTFDEKMSPGTKNTWDMINSEIKIHLLIK